MFVSRKQNKITDRPVNHTCGCNALATPSNQKVIAQHKKPLLLIDSHYGGPNGYLMFYILLLICSRAPWRWWRRKCTNAAMGTSERVFTLTQIRRLRLQVCMRRKCATLARICAFATVTARVCAHNPCDTTRNREWVCKINFSFSLRVAQLRADAHTLAFRARVPTARVTEQF